MPSIVPAQIKLASRIDCTSCMGCINACTHEALSSIFDKNGYFKIIKNSKNCTECGLCTKICPIVNPVNIRNSRSIAYAAWNENLFQRHNSASGGIFAAVATYILKDGGIVYGASINGFKVEHIRIDHIKDLAKLQGVKYQLSILGNHIFKSVRRDIMSGKTVLYSGMSCQIAALYNYLGRTSTERLITIDTICGGFSTILPMLELQSSGMYSGIMSFRDKNDGWKSHGFLYNLRMKNADGTISTLGFNNMVLRTFSTHLLKQSSCLSCQFNGVVRNSDLTIGDFWGTNLFPNEHPGGLSCVIAHNQKAIDILNNSELELHEVEIDEIAKGNSNLYWSKYPYLRHSLSRNFALLCLRLKLNSLALKISSYTGLLSLGWRLYMRLNNLQREKYYNRNIKSN